MHAYKIKIIKTKNICLLFIASIGIAYAVGPPYTSTPSAINSGGGLSSSANYLTHYSLGQLAGTSFNGTSYQIKTDALSFPDIDADGILNTVDNCQSVSNTDQINSDSDSLGNACDADDDNDGLSDLIEASLGTNPLLVDTDGDGLNDNIDPNPLTANADGDLAPYGAPDGIINVADLLIAQQIVLGAIAPTAQDIIHADIYPAGTPDGVIDISDLILLEQLLLPPAP